MKFLGTELKPVNSDELLKEMKKAKNGTQFVIDIITHKREEGNDEVEVVIAHIIRNKSK